MIQAETYKQLAVRIAQVAVILLTSENNPVFGAVLCVYKKAKV